jgi:hypothetical protein
MAGSELASYCEGQIVAKDITINLEVPNSSSVTYTLGTYTDFLQNNNPALCFLHSCMMDSGSTENGSVYHSIQGTSPFSITISNLYTHYSWFYETGTLKCLTATTP